MGYIYAFKNRFLQLDVDETFQYKIRLHRQGKDESVTDYVTSTRTLMWRRIPHPPSQQVGVFVKNPKSNVEWHICGCNVDSGDQFLVMVKQLERLVREDKEANRTSD